MKNKAIIQLNKYQRQFKQLLLLLLSLFLIPGHPVKLYILKCSVLHSSRHNQQNLYPQLMQVISLFPLFFSINILHFGHCL